MADCVRMGRGRRSRYVPYDLLHRTWQEQVLTLISTRLPENVEALRLVAAMRRRYPRGFVAHLQGGYRHS